MALSSEDMYLAAGRGKCVKILHVIGDMLCQIDSKPPSKPDLGPPGIDPESSSQEDEPNSSQLYQTETDQTEALSIELDTKLDLANNTEDKKSASEVH